MSRYRSVIVLATAAILGASGFAVGAVAGGKSYDAVCVGKPDKPLLAARKNGTCKGGWDLATQKGARAIPVTVSVQGAATPLTGTIPSNHVITINGIQGIVGPSGAIGLTGDKGDKGDTGTIPSLAPSAVRQIIAHETGHVCSDNPGELCGGSGGQWTAADAGTGDSPPAFWQGRDGVVHLQGSVAVQGNGGVAPAAIAYLPVGMRPDNTRVFVVAGAGGGPHVRTISISSDGAVTPDSTDFGLSLDGVSFYPSDACTGSSCPAPSG